jgi:hypothetical protein
LREPSFPERHKDLVGLRPCAGARVHIAKIGLHEWNATSKTDRRDEWRVEHEEE